MIYPVMNRQIQLFSLVLSFVFLLGCASHSSTASVANKTAAQEFDQLYVAWHHDLETEGDGSDNTTWESRRPTFRNIVAMGKPALPFLEQRLIENKAEDALLAIAIVEICGWDIHDFQAKNNFGEFRDDVLKKLREDKMIPNQ
jgi:hypothetical protein